MNAKIIERTALKLWALAQDLRQEAARAGEQGRGYAVAAFELSRYADGLFDADEETAAELGRKIELVALNLTFEVIRVEEAAPGANKQLAPICGALRGAARALSGETDAAKTLLPEAAEPLTTVKVAAEVLPFTVGGALVCEMCANVSEVFRAREDDVSDGKVMLRGEAVRVVRPAGARVDADKGLLVAVINYGGAFALVLDEQVLSPLYLGGGIGKAAACDEAHPMAGAARECWNAVGGGQFVFVDWGRVGSSALS